MPDLVARVAAGATAGFAATGPMTLVMAAGREGLPEREQYPLPPRTITERTAQAADLGQRMTDAQKEAATAVGHFGYGAATGAVYGVLAPLLPFGPVLNGVAFGLGVWAGSYLGWLPAAGLHPPAHHESAGRNATMIAAHVVWGAVLGILTDQMVGGRDGDGEGPRTARSREFAAAG
jgi:uncharacterized membrane protein YagU involved in acid resistance